MSDIYRYRWDGPNPARIADLRRDVQPGDELDCPGPLNHPHLTPLNKAAKDAAAAVEKADREMGARWDQREIDAQQSAPPEEAAAAIAPAPTTADTGQAKE